jgi:homoserine kinase type II
LFAALPWVAGAHRSGLSLTCAECEALGGLLGQVHAGLAGVMPAAPAEVVVPVTAVAAARERIDRYLGVIREKGALDAFDRHARRRLLERRELLASAARLRPGDGAVAGPAGWAHGDFHDLNVLWEGGRVSAVLDWDRLGVRPLAGEVARSATLLFGYGDGRGLDTGRVAAFSRGYRAVSWLTDEQLRDAVHRLWWERLCDLWQLTWHYERGRASCDHLFGPASALLPWWTAHRGEVVDAFTSR